jgi:hypothetical protein
MPLRILVAVLVIGAFAAAGFYFLRPWLERPPAPPAPVPRVEAPAPKAEGPKYPIAADEAALPKLGESDPTMRESLFRLIDPAAVAKFLDVNDIVRRSVATVDALPRETLARRINPVKAIGGAFLTVGKDDTLSVGPRNANRYTPFMKMAESLDTPKVVAAYVHFYPLFQQAYVELGFPNGYFNDRVVEVIDHLLAAPEPKDPVLLVTPHVLYEFADVDLEALSAGQKIMVRVGADNEARLKAKLQEIRAEIVANSKKP